jgi:glutathione peroxidase
MNDINGKEIDFADYRGKHRAFLIVNVASKCGLTDTNYKELVRLDD